MAITACGGDSQASNTGGTQGESADDPVRGGTLVFAEVTPIDNFQTQSARFYEKANVLNSVLDRLTYFDPDKDELVPWIASKF